MTCEAKFIKSLLFIFNFIFVACGITLIAIGAVAKQSGNEYTVFFNSKFVTGPTLVIVAGCIVFLIAFFGCCGAMRDSSWMLMCFAGLMLLILVLQIAGAIAAFVYRKQLGDAIKQNMNSSIQQNKTDALEVWDKLQQKYDCCGVDGPNDWVASNYTAPPNSCFSDKKVLYEKGCYTALEDLMKHYIALVGGAAIGIAFIEILGIVFAWCLSSAIRSQYESV